MSYTGDLHANAGYIMKGSEPEYSDTSEKCTWAKVNAHVGLHLYYILYTCRTGAYFSTSLHRLLTIVLSPPPNTEMYTLRSCSDWLIT